MDNFELYQSSRLVSDVTFWAQLSSSRSLINVTTSRMGSEVHVICVCSVVAFRWSERWRLRTKEYVSPKKEVVTPVNEVVTRAVFSPSLHSDQYSKWDYFSWDNYEGVHMVLCRHLDYFDEVDDFS